MDFVLKNDQSDDPVCETKHPHYPQVKPKASNREADLIRSPLDVLPLLVQMRGIECVRCFGGPSRVKQIPEPLCVVEALISRIHSTEGSEAQAQNRGHQQRVVPVDSQRHRRTDARGSNAQRYAQREPVLCLPRMAERDPRPSEYGRVQDDAYEIHEQLDNALEEGGHARVSLSLDDEDVSGENPSPDHAGDGSQSDGEEEQQLLQPFDRGGDCAI
mmetsp:Transcript_13042/g.25577  ORF Transcript_13042/g.25577 Transcript_13042/m.25577 type:complete len:216 (-) Transcript_13042:187-834(-)